MNRKQRRIRLKQKTAKNIARQNQLKENDPWTEKKTASIEKNYSKIIETLIKDSKYVIRSRKGKIRAKVPGNYIRLANGNKLETMNLQVYVERTQIKVQYKETHTFELNKNNLGNSFDKGLEYLCQSLTEKKYEKENQRNNRFTVYN